MIKINRVWSMPSIWTFGMKPIRKLFSEYSVGIGANRGFEIEEILLICHGACHNDTIITVDRKK